MENGIYEQIVSYLKREWELNELEAPDELQINTVTQQATQQNTEKPKPTFNHCKKPGLYRNQCRQLKGEENQAQNNTNSAGNKNNKIGGQTNSNSNDKIPENTNALKTNNQKDKKPRPAYPPCSTCSKTKHSTEKCYFRANAANRPPPRNRRPDGQNYVQQRNIQSNSDANVQAAAQTLNWKRHVFTPELYVTYRRQI